MHLSTLAADLVLMLAVAGVTSVIFKKIRQPLVLGYVFAGFLIGPVFSAAGMPTVGDMEGITIWAEIGIIFIMFAHGLEFSFHKLARAGHTPFVTALTKVCGLALLGFLAGRLLGWGLIDSLVLGGMLTMSSAAIIVKALEELNLRGREFTRIVAGALIVADVVGVFLMVFMTTYTQNKSGGELAVAIAQLMLYFALWMILGIFVIPSLLKRAKNLMNDETLLIVTLGVCFGMAFLFSQIGLSTALGAFIAGSILAGTIFSEKTEQLLKPVKDLFGAVFFIYVGMLVEPEILAAYAWPIILITLVTLFGKLVFSSLGVLLSGGKLHTAVTCGASLTQIGEVAFIIAALGRELGLTGDFLYPVIVSVSVITTFTTPYFIKYSDKIYQVIQIITPAKLLSKIDGQPDAGKTDREPYWKWFAKQYVADTLIKGIIAFGFLQLGIYFIGPFLEKVIPSFGGRALTAGFLLLLMSPFLATLLYQRGKNVSIKHKANRVPLLIAMTIRTCLTVAIILFTIVRFLGFSSSWAALPVVALLILISHNDWIMGHYLHLETRFLANFHERKIIDSTGSDIVYDPSHGWISERLWVGAYAVGEDCKDAGAALRDLKWRRDYHINIIKIASDKKQFNIPDAGHKLRAGDTVYLLGTKDKLDMFGAAAAKSKTWVQRQGEAVTLRDFIVSNGNDHGEYRLFCYSVLVEKGRRFEGKNIKSSKIGSDFNCNIIGVQRDNYHIIYPAHQFVLNPGDQIWLLGGYKMVGKLIMDDLIQTEENELTDALDGRR